MPASDPSVGGTRRAVRIGALVRTELVRPLERRHLLGGRRRRSGGGVAVSGLRRRCGAAVVIVVVVLVVALGDSDDSTTPAPTTTATMNASQKQPQEPEEERADLLSFRPDDSLEAGVTNIWLVWAIKNSSSEKSDYAWKREAADADGTRLAKGSQPTTDVRPGQTVRGESPTTLKGVKRPGMAMPGTKEADMTPSRPPMGEPQARAPQVRNWCPCRITRPWTDVGDQVIEVDASCEVLPLVIPRGTTLFGAVLVPCLSGPASLTAVR